MVSKMSVTAGSVRIPVSAESLRYDSDEEDIINTQTRTTVEKIRLWAIQGGVIFITLGATLSSTYFKMHPIITVGTTATLATAMKAKLRSVPRKIRYAGIFISVGAFFGLDYYLKTQKISLDFFPISCGIAMACFQRSVKLWMIGKNDRDK